MLEIGDLVRDRVSGFEGIITRLDQWFGSPKLFNVQARGLNASGLPYSASFYEDQLELVEKGAVKPSPDLVSLFRETDMSVDGGIQLPPAKKSRTKNANT